jgi:hypothetical protein
MRNNLGTSESPYYAFAAWSETVGSEGFIDRMAAGRTTLSKTDIIAVFQLAREELGRLLAEGRYVCTPLGAALPVAKGKFLSPSDPFLPKNPGSGHELRIEFRIDPAIEAKALASVQCLRDKEGDRRLPRILDVTFLPSGSDGQAGAVRFLRVTGKRMKFDAANCELGLFFRDESGVETRAEVYALVQPSTVIAVVPPALGRGGYRLIVRTVSAGGERLEDMAMEPLWIDGDRSGFGESGEP